MTFRQLFPLFCDDPGFCHDETHFSRRINDKILEAALTLAQPKNSKRLFLFPSKYLQTQYVYSNTYYGKTPLSKPIYNTGSKYPLSMSG